MPKRGLIYAVLCLGLLASIFARAAMPQAQFPFTEAQIKALGVRLSVLSESGMVTGPAYPATVELPPSSEHIVSAPAAGLVRQIPVRINDVVTRGQIVARLISPDLGATQLQLVHAATRTRLARQTATRERSLHKEGIIPLRRVQEADAQLAEAQAILSQSQAALELAGMARSDITRVLRSGKFDNNLALRAPATGAVIEINVKPGQRIAAADPLLRIADTATLWLEVRAPADTARTWAKGALLHVAGRDAQARILSTDTAVDPASQTVAVRALVVSGAQQLRPGEAVKAIAPAPDLGNGWNIPLSALARDGARAVVFVRTAQGFDARPVEVVASAGQRARVRGRLAAGDRIAIAGVVALKAAWLGEGGE